MAYHIAPDGPLTFSQKHLNWFDSQIVESIGIHRVTPVRMGLNKPDEDNPALVGGAGLHLRDKELYLEYTTPSSLSGWHAQWFYLGNHQPSLPGWDNSQPQLLECWLKKPTEEERSDIPELMQQIKVLNDKGVTEESVAYSSIERHIQPFQQRVHLGFAYEGIRDSSRMARDVPSVEEIMRRVTRLFTGVNSEPFILRKFGADYSTNPGNVERLRSDAPEPVFEEPARDPPAERDGAMLQPIHRAHSEWRCGSGEPLQQRQHQAVARQRRSPPVTSPSFSTRTGNKTSPRGLVVPTSHIERSREKSVLLIRIGDVLPRTHDAEDNLEAKKAKNLKLQEELEVLKTSHRDAMIDQQRKHDMAIRKVKDLTAQKEKEKEQLQKALEEIQLKYSDLDEEHKTVTRQLSDAEKQLIENTKQIQSMARDRERKEKVMWQLTIAAHQLCKFVHPVTDGRSLVQRLVDAPTSIAG
ncbi:hypothetical protein C2845_PM11G03370 [Panicum miliaceum]|uniref:Retrotransposon protein, putative, unclassified n=1 Tax=Panicum miliaceum TaxID=4540 RepID=A0A3L6RQY5_PANMI|nr:hypothetical protein C2845_PM11G03370 [Panicum miliaceum]